MLRVAYPLQHIRCPLRTQNSCIACLMASTMAGPTIYRICWHPICPSKSSGHLTDQIYYNLKTVSSKRAVSWQPLMRSNYRLFISKSSPPSSLRSLTASVTPKRSRYKRGRPASGWRAFQIACGCPKGTHRRPTEYFRVPNDFICIYI